MSDEFGTEFDGVENELNGNVPEPDGELLDDDLLFGDFESEIPEYLKEKHPFNFVVENVKITKTPDDKGFRNLIVEVQVSEDVPDEDKKYVGIRPADIWIPFYPGVNHDVFSNFTSEQKKKWERGRKEGKALARAFGYTEAELKQFKLSYISGAKGIMFAAKTYLDKKSNISRIQMDTLQPIEAVEVGGDSNS